MPIGRGLDAVAIRLRQLTSDQTEELGEFCVELLQGDSPWIFRRKESVTVLDEATIRRQQSVDFTLDTIESLGNYKEICDRVFGDEVCAAPLLSSTRIRPPRCHST